MSGSDDSAYEIAVIGMSGRFPGAGNLARYWENLRDGVESLSAFSDEELEAAGVDRAALDDPDYVKAGGVLEDVESFDAQFFGFNPREAEVTDPQHRVFLECAWEAIEDAGYGSERHRQRVGVFAGMSESSYLINNLLPNGALIESVGGLQTSIGNDRDFLSTQVSYRLNLRGPSFTVQTACSTSLVAIHLACQSLLNRECDMAMAGGVSVRLPQKQGYFYQEGGILSPDGHCRAFDEGARGTVSGSGAGVVVLKRLSDALADRDTIHAVIKGSATNNDGSLKVGFTAPSVDGQAAVIEEALGMAMVEPETISYVEAHGTGTPLGDPIEVAALTEAFRAKTSKKGFCAIGSVKTNLGHLDAAAGVAGFIKTVLALKHRLLPPSLHFQRPNAKIDFANSPFYVNDRLREWDASPRRAGVSSFGIGGTNAHVILEEAPAAEPPAGDPPYHLIVFSARTRSALDAATANHAAHLRRNAGASLADVAHTLRVGRRAFEHRRAVVCRGVEDLLAALDPLDAKRVMTGSQELRDRPVAFVFSGQGTQYAGMGRELYELEPAFRAQVDRCCDFLCPLLGLDLRDLLYPPESQAERAAEQLEQTFITQPALFVIGHALASLLIEWGVRPQAMIGHSIGEYVAACLAGVFSLEDALTVVAARGRLMQQLPGGAMLAVPLSEQAARPLVEKDSKLAIAAVNAPSLCIISGPADAVSDLEHRLGSDGLTCSRLRTSHAFHSGAMEPILGQFVEHMKKVRLNSPAARFISNVTGTWITTGEATSPDYWANHLRQTVRFQDGIEELLREPDMVFLEVGPGRMAAGPVNQQGNNGAGRIVVPAMRRPRDQQSDYGFLLNALGRLWVEGVDIDWAGFQAGEPRSRVPLPTYPFERERYWIEPAGPAQSGAREKTFERKPDISDWFYVPSWKRSAASEPARQQADEKSCWLIFSDTGGLGDRIIKRLEQGGHYVVEVKAGSEFSRAGGRAYSINPRGRDDYGRLLAELRALDKTPRAIIHLWNVTPAGGASPARERFDQSQYLGFYGLIFLAQAIGEEFLSEAIRIGVVSNGLQEVTGDEPLDPEKATLLGATKVISLEYSNVACRSIDVVTGSGEETEERLAAQVVAELGREARDSAVAYRGSHRWEQIFEPVRLEADSSGRARLRDEGVYLLTGGLRDLDLALAEHLAGNYRAKLVLVARAGFPERDRWERWLETEPEGEETSRKINRLLALEASGAEVMVASADITSYEQTRAVVERATERFGRVHGAIHTAENTGGGLVQLKTPEMAGQVIAPKVRGALALWEALKDSRPDFIALFSSTLAISGVVGQSDYCAANAFLDSFARANFSESGVFTVAINWNTPQWEDWQEAAMDAVPELQAQLRRARAEYGVGYADGIEAFERILRGAEPQVVVATQDFQAVVARQNAAAGSGLLNLLESAGSAQQHSRDGLDTDYAAPTNEVERVMAEVWQKLFGMDRMGIHDDFFSLGGNSLLAIQLASQLRKEFKVELPLSKLFESPTIAGLAVIISESQAKQKELEEIERMLKEVEALSNEEVEAELEILQSGDEEK
ncbi:MAG: SDR family NAD(P)-dependent oxidoreductase [Blastocatellia bacterium]